MITRKNMLSVALAVTMVAAVGMGSYLVYAGSQANLGVSLNNGLCSSPILNTTDIVNPVPSGVWNEAPYPGFEYFLSYNISGGNIASIQAEPSCEVLQNLSNCGYTGGNISMSVASSCLFPPESGYAVLNMTSYSDITTIVHHSSAYYVNIQTLQVQIRPGWTDCSNPNYGNGTTPCN